MARIRALLVDDSVTVRTRLATIIATDPELELVGEAGDGKRAIELCRALRPDVVSLDMDLPLMSGLAATEFIMAYCPTPIVIVTGSEGRGELFRSYDALAAGAVEVLGKLRAGGAEDWDRLFLSTLKLASRIKVITHPRARLRGMGGPPAPAPEPPPRVRPCRAVAVGASTGGPGAVRQVLRALSPAFPIPLLLVIHVGSPLGPALAEWLDGESPLRVGLARDGEPLPELGRSRVVMAPPGAHLVLERGRLRLSDGAERHACRPSVDVLFESMARELGPAAAACLLTGMGRDGAAGMLAVRRAGGATLAQDEETSVVYGMPREAVFLGAAEQVLPLEAIASALNAIAGTHARAEKRRT